MFSPFAILLLISLIKNITAANLNTSESGQRPFVVYANGQTAEENGQQFQVIEQEVPIAQQEQQQQHLQQQQQQQHTEGPQQEYILVYEPVEQIQGYGSASEPQYFNNDQRFGQRIQLQSTQYQPRETYTYEQSPYQKTQQNYLQSQQEQHQQHQQHVIQEPQQQSDGKEQIISKDDQSSTAGEGRPQYVIEYVLQEQVDQSPNYGNRIQNGENQLVNDQPQEVYEDSNGEKNQNNYQVNQNSVSDSPVYNDAPAYVLTYGNQEPEVQNYEHNSYSSGNAQNVVSYNQLIAGDKFYSQPGSNNQNDNAESPKQVILQYVDAPDDDSDYGNEQQAFKKNPINRFVAWKGLVEGSNGRNSNNKYGSHNEDVGYYNDKDKNDKRDENVNSKNNYYVKSGPVQNSQDSTSGFDVNNNRRYQDKPRLVFVPPKNFDPKMSIRVKPRLSYGWMKSENHFLSPTYNKKKEESNHRKKGYKRPNKIVPKLIRRRQRQYILEPDIVNKKPIKSQTKEEPKKYLHKQPSISNFQKVNTITIRHKPGVSRVYMS